MLQTVRGALDQTSIKAKAEKAQEEAKAKSKAGPNFHARQAAAKAADPDNNAYRQAIANGTAAAHNFLGAVKNPAHPDHETKIKVFKQAHGMDEDNTIADFQARACRDAGAGPYELANGAYEQNVCKPYKPTGDVTATKMAFYDNLQTALRNKWDSAGYSGDHAFIENYCSKYGLTRDENSVAINNRIQPRP